MFDDELLALARRVLERCRGTGLRLAAAESCTGGLVIGCLTEIPGSSDVVDRGYVTYSDAAKQEMLGVRSESLARFGAVSEIVAREMAEGALARSGADLAVAVTGIAGPGGGTPDKPVGLVHFAALRRGEPARHQQYVFAGDRREVRLAAVRTALAMLAERAEGSPILV